MSSTNSYKQVFKATSIFGGVQIFSILINLVRSKLIAILLGTVGFGLAGLYNSPLTFIVSLTGLGIGVSAVRDIALAHESGDQTKLARTVFVFRRWVWLTGILGVLVTVASSFYLSELSFGDRTETFSFIALSITLLFASLSSGQSAVLRGTRRIKDTAKANLYGSLVGLFLTIPCYYFFGVRGVIPGIIIASIITLVFSWFYSRKIAIESVNVTWRETWSMGLSMAKMGVMMSLAGLISNAVSYIVVSFLSKNGDIETVGLYNAGWSITNQYVSLVFAAMAADYYPRLSGLVNDKTKFDDAVNQQSEIAILIIGPLMLFYLISLPILVPLILSNSFLGVLGFSRWVVLGMLFKGTAWALGFILLAKGNSKLFLLTEILANVLILAGYLTGFKFFGLEGIGIGFFVLYLIYLLIVLFIAKYKYDFSFSYDFKKILFIQFSLSFVAFLTSQYLAYNVSLCISLPILLLSAAHALYEIDKRIGIKAFILKLKKRK